MATGPINSRQNEKAILDHIFLHLAVKIGEVCAPLKFLVVDKFENLVSYAVYLEYVCDAEIDII